MKHLDARHWLERQIQKRTEEELRVQTTALHAAANAVMITDHNGRIHSVNPAFTALTGYTAQEVVGRNPRFLKSGKQDEAVYRNLWQTISSGRVWSGELTNRRKDGSLYIEEMTITPLRNADGAIARYIAIKQDISERKQAEAEAAQLAAIVEYSSDAIISKDLEGTILTWNAAAGRLFGYEAEEVIGQNIALLIPENYRAEEIAILEKVRKGRGVQHYEAVRFKKDGTPLAVSLTISPVRDAAGKIVGTSKIVRDISERKRAEEEILNLNAELEQRVHDRTAQLEAANRELEAFSYSVSHDLRAPLRHIGGFADLLVRAAGPGLPDKSRHYLEQILDATRQMGCLIDDLLLFSRMGRAEMRLQPVDLGQLVQEAKKQFEPESKGRDIRWKHGALLEVQADKALLRQVMLNLLSNAVKYTRPRNPAEIEIGCDGGSPEETVVFVRDNGVGFNMEYAPKLFGVFQRLHLDEEFEGTGIGLASVRRIIARHGGRTWAEGKVNAGATFYFSLPKNNHPPDVYDRTQTHSPG